MRLHRTEHSAVVAADLDVLYGLVADVTLWPAVFGPTVHVRHLERGATSERFQIWALVGDEVANWVSRRTLDPVRRRVEFEQERTHPPIGAMGGEWIFNELPGGRTEVVLRHHFGAVDDDPGTIAWITEAVDRNSPEELAALARVAEFGHPVGDVVFSFTDTVRLTGPATDAYRFVHRADLWADRLPHVAKVAMTETAPGVQDLTMETVTPDGAAHTTRSVRVCEEPAWIAYKQQVTPKLLLGHSGLWTFTERVDGAVATARHTVAIDPSAVPEALGPGRDLADAREYVRLALGRNSRTTLAHAGAFERSGA